MFLRDISGGAISGTGTINVKDKGVKAIKVLVTGDGTNAAVVLIRKNDSFGDKIIDISTKTPGDYPVQAVLVEAVDNIYYSITGTGALAQILGAVA